MDKTKLCAELNSLVAKAMLYGEGKMLEEYNAVFESIYRIADKLQLDVSLMPTEAIFPQFIVPGQK